MLCGVPTQKAMGGVPNPIRHVQCPPFPHLALSWILSKVENLVISTFSPAKLVSPSVALLAKLVVFLSLDCAKNLNFLISIVCEKFNKFSKCMCPDISVNHLT